MILCLAVMCYQVLVLVSFLTRVKARLGQEMYLAMNGMMPM